MRRLTTSRRVRAKDLLLAATLLLVAGCLSESQDQGLQPPASGPDDGNNSAPKISGNAPQAVTVGGSYVFSPTASDADGDALTFSIENKPSWATFDTGTGTLSGTPTLANIGVFSNIRISVTDGKATSSLAPISVEVTQVALGSASLSWTAPTMNEDGTALTNLAGYRVYYGQSSGDYSNVITIENASVTTYVVENLAPATWFFAVTAVNSAGFESRLSNEANKVVN